MKPKPWKESRGSAMWERTALKREETLQRHQEDGAQPQRHAHGGVRLDMDHAHSVSTWETSSLTKVLGQRMCGRKTKVVTRPDRWRRRNGTMVERPRHWQYENDYECVDKKNETGSEKHCSISIGCGQSRSIKSLKDLEVARLFTLRVKCKLTARVKRGWRRQSA